MKPGYGLVQSSPRLTHPENPKTNVTKEQVAKEGREGREGRQGKRRKQHKFDLISLLEEFFQQKKVENMVRVK